MIKIEDIYKELEVPQNIIEHMKVVAVLCKKIADMLIAKGKKIDKKLLIQAALLHDCLKIHDNHEETMAEFLRKKGQPKLANLIAKHGFFSIDELKTLEEKILYYADKRVAGNKIVSLDKRFSEWKRLYKNESKMDAKHVAETEKKVKDLEKMLLNCRNH